MRRLSRSLATLANESVFLPEVSGVRFCALHEVLDLASLKLPQEDYRGATALLERALKVFTKKLGENHPHTVATRRGLRAARQKVRVQQLGPRAGET